MNASTIRVLRILSLSLRQTRCLWFNFFCKRPISKLKFKKTCSEAVPVEFDEGIHPVRVRVNEFWFIRIITFIQKKRNKQECVKTHYNVLGYYAIGKRKCTYNFCVRATTRARLKGNMRNELYRCADWAEGSCTQCKRRWLQLLHRGKREIDVFVAVRMRIWVRSYSSIDTLCYNRCVTKALIYHSVEIWVVISFVIGWTFVGEREMTMMESLLLLLLLFNFVRLTAIFARNGFQFVVKTIYCIETYDNNSWSKFKKERKMGKEKKKKKRRAISFSVWLFLGPTTFFRVCEKIKSCLLFLVATIGMHCPYTGLHTKFAHIAFLSLFL